MDGTREIFQTDGFPVRPGGYPLILVATRLLPHSGRERLNGRSALAHTVSDSADMQKPLRLYAGVFELAGESS
jgi:hypothetical protein